MICLPKDCSTVSFLVILLPLIVNCGIKWSAFCFVFIYNTRNRRMENFLLKYL
jgi:hypothetical protein